MGIIVNCKDCPFNGQDNVYCRTCSIPATCAAHTARRVARRRARLSTRRRRTEHRRDVEALRRLSEVVYSRQARRWVCVPPWLFTGCY